MTAFNQIASGRQRSTTNIHDSGRRKNPQLDPVQNGFVFIDFNKYGLADCPGYIMRGRHAEQEWVIYDPTGQIVGYAQYAAPWDKIIAAIRQRVDSDRRNQVNQDLGWLCDTLPGSEDDYEPTGPEQYGLNQYGF